MPKRQKTSKNAIFAFVNTLNHFKGVSGEVFTGIVNSSDVDGRYAVHFLEAPAGVSPARHIHHREDEIVHVIDGQMAVLCGAKVQRIGVGDTVVLPRGIPHTWLVTSRTSVRLLVILVPGGSEHAFEHISNSRPDAASEQIEATMARDFGVEIVGPPLDATELTYRLIISETDLWRE